MENELTNEFKEILKSYKYKCVEIKELDDYGNEQVFSFILDFDNQTSEQILKDTAQALKEQIEVICDEISMGDYATRLEVVFHTNNHYIFVISALKYALK